MGTKNKKYGCSDRRLKVRFLQLERQPFLSVVKKIYKVCKIPNARPFGIISIFADFRLKYSWFWFHNK